MKDGNDHRFVANCRHVAWQAAVNQYSKVPGSYYKSVIDNLICDSGRGRLEDIEYTLEHREYLQNFWDKSSSAFFMNNILKEDRQRNYMALRPKESALMNALKSLEKPNDPNDRHEKSDSEEQMIDAEAIEPGKQKLLVKGESSSVLIDTSEFDIIDQAYKPGFVFEEFFKRQEANATVLSWETKMHDIYEPIFSSKNESLEKDFEIGCKEKKNLGIKYSFQVDTQKMNLEGLDYFLSETNMLEYRANMRSLHGESIKKSPMLSKGKISGSIAVPPVIITKPKSNFIQKDKDTTGLIKQKANLKKGIKKQAFIQFKAGKKPHLSQGVTGLEEPMNIKYMPADTFFAKNFNPQPTIVRTLKKKNSILYIQTRSNSREHTGEYKVKDMMRSTTKEREAVINKKKMRIRDRCEQPQAKDTTTSALIKKRKKKLETADLQPESSLISKLLFKSLKQKYDPSLPVGSSAAGLHLKPSINLENSYLTDEFHGRLFESCNQKSPKYVRYLGLKSKNSEFVADSNAKLKSQQSGIRQMKRSKNKAKSCNKKKVNVARLKLIPSLFVGYQGPILGSPPEINLRSSLEKIGGITRYLMGKSGKRDDLGADILAYNQMNLKALDHKAREYWRARPNTAEEVPYFSQRSKTTNKKPKEKRGVSKKREDHSREPIKYLAGVNNQFSSMNSPAKTKHFGKNSSSLIER